MAEWNSLNTQNNTTIYNTVIMDVIKNCKPDFDAAGYSEDLLPELQQVESLNCVPRIPFRAVRKTLRAPAWSDGAVALCRSCGNKSSPSSCRPVLSKSQTSSKVPPPPTTPSNGSLVTRGILALTVRLRSQVRSGRLIETPPKEPLSQWATTRVPKLSPSPRSRPISGTRAHWVEALW